MKSEIRKRMAGGIVGLILLTMTVSVANAQVHEDRRDAERGPDVLFTQRDEVQAFDVATGLGYQTGIATGRISGTTSVTFHFTITGPPGANGAIPISFNNNVIITDIDGDQIFFNNSGTGMFHVGLPGDAFQGSGGPLTGTYVLTGGTGKYQSWTVGTTFKYSAIFTNPPRPGALGTVYAKVSTTSKDD